MCICVFLVCFSVICDILAAAFCNPSDASLTPETKKVLKIVFLSVPFCSFVFLSVPSIAKVGVRPKSRVPTNLQLSTSNQQPLRL
jgi:hypothetical protein